MGLPRNLDREPVDMRCTVRPLRREEIPEIMNLAVEAVPAMRLTSADLERNLFETPPEGALQLAVTADDHLAGVGCGALREQGADRASPLGHVKLLAVDAAFRRRGLGRLLLSRVEEELRRRGVRRVTLGGAAPVYLQPGVPLSAGDALAFFRERGYRRIDSRRSMTVSLADLDLDTEAAERALRDRGMVFRRARREDEGSVGKRIRETFSSTWATELACSLRTPHPATHLAFQREELAGFAVGGLWARNAFGPMGTLPEKQGKGVGGILLKRCLSDLRRRGEREVVISWIGPEAFYRRTVGARTTLFYAVLEKELPDEAAR